MRVSAKQSAENRQRILDVAGRLFREQGFAGIGVDGLMKEAGLTHGGFYGHFASKADLAEQACAAALARSAGKWQALLAGAAKDGGLAEIAGSYLSARHRDDPGGGCLFAALGGELVRQPDALRAMVTDGVRDQLGILETVAAEPSARDRRERAIATLSGFVGAMLLARVVDDAALSDEILAAGSAAFGAAKPVGGTHSRASRARRGHGGRAGRTRG